MYEDNMSEYLHQLEMEKLNLIREVGNLRRALAEAHRQRAILEEQLRFYYL